MVVVVCGRERMEMDFLSTRTSEMRISGMSMSGGVVDENGGGKRKYRSKRSLRSNFVSSVNGEGDKTKNEATSNKNIDTIEANRNSDYSNGAEVQKQQYRLKTLCRALNQIRR